MRNSAGHKVDFAAFHAAVNVTNLVTHHGFMAGEVRRSSQRGQHFGKGYAPNDVALAKLRSP